MRASKARSKLRHYKEREIHQPRVESKSFSSSWRTSSPRMASPNSSCASSTACGKIRHRQFPGLCDLTHKLEWRAQFLRFAHQFVVAHGGELFHVAHDRAHVPHGFHYVAGAGFALRTNHRRALADAPQRFAQVARPAHKRNAIIMLPDVILFIGGSENFAFVYEVDFQCLQYFCFREVPDAHLGHHRNRHRGHDFADHFDRGHARHAAFFADVRRHALERHDRARSSVFGNFRLHGVCDVHDHATFEHLRQADFYAPLIRALVAVPASVWLLPFHLLSPLDSETLPHFATNLFYFLPITTKRPLPRASTSPFSFRISPAIKRFLPFCSTSRPSTRISLSTFTGFKYSTVNSAVTARTSRNRQTLPMASSKSTAMIPPCANPAPPWYLSPSTNRPTILCPTLSCSNVSFIPPALSPPQPKHLFAGFGSSLMVSAKYPHSQIPVRVPGSQSSAFSKGQRSAFTED